MPIYGINKYGLRDYRIDFLFRDSVGDKELFTEQDVKDFFKELAAENKSISSVTIPAAEGLFFICKTIQADIKTYEDLIDFLHKYVVEKYKEY